MHTRRLRSQVDNRFSFTAGASCIGIAVELTPVHEFQLSPGVAMPTTSSIRRSGAVELRVHAGRWIPVLAAACALQLLAACQDILAPLPRLTPTEAERLLVSADTTDIRVGALEGTRADIRGLNNLGQVTGGWDPGARQNEFTPYRWTPASGFTAIIPLGANTSYGTDINDAGVVVGVSSLGQLATRAAVAVGTQMVNLGLLYSPAPEGPPPYTEGDSRAYAINNAGEIVGSSSTAIAGGGVHAVLWNAAHVIQDLGTLGGTSSRALDINAAGQVIGMSDVSGGGAQHAFVWTAGGGMQDLTTMLGGVTNVVAINDAGQIAGDYTTAAGETHAFRYTPGAGLLDLGTLGGDASAATGLNNLGQVVGSSSTSGGVTHAFLWTTEEGMEDITALTGIPDVRKLNDDLQTITGAPFTGVPRIITLVVVPRAPQSITFTSTAPSPAAVGGTYTVSATATSGLAVTFGTTSPSVCTVSGATVSFVGYGTCVITADQGGNTSFRPAPQATQQVSVAWPFGGFAKPLDDPPAFNTTRAGGTVTLRFSLGGDRGAAVFQPASPSSVEVSCTTGAPSGAATVVPPGSWELRYQKGPDRYTLRWQTESAWDGSCRRLTLAFADGTEHSALFRFR
jgi:probable HAF family extracellular repeat protein